MLELHLSSSDINQLLLDWIIDIKYWKNIISQHDGYRHDTLLNLTCFSNIFSVTSAVY